MPQFYVERGNWYIDENTWAEFGVFRQGEKHPFAMTKDEEKANEIAKLFEEEYTGESWKGDLDDLGRVPE